MLNVMLAHSYTNDKKAYGNCSYCNTITNWKRKIAEGCNKIPEYKFICSSCAHAGMR